MISRALVTLIQSNNWQFVLNFSVLISSTWYALDFIVNKNTKVVIQKMCNPNSSFGFSSLGKLKLACYNFYLNN